MLISSSEIRHGTQYYEGPGIPKWEKWLVMVLGYVWLLSPRGPCHCIANLIEMLLRKTYIHSSSQQAVKLPYGLKTTTLGKWMKIVNSIYIYIYICCSHEYTLLIVLHWALGVILKKSLFIWTIHHCYITSSLLYNRTLFDWSVHLTFQWVVRAKPDNQALMIYMTCRHCWQIVGGPNWQAYSRL